MKYWTYLPGGASAAYLDLLDALLVAPMPSRGVSFLRRQVSGRWYWYLKYTIGRETHWQYLGPDSSSTTERINRVRAQLESDRPSRTVRTRLARTAKSAGAYAPTAAERRVYQAMAQAGLFLAGGVLVGTHAWLNLGNLLGVSWSPVHDRTEDIDVGVDSHFSVAVPGGKTPLETVLKAVDPDMFPVPALSRKDPSTSFSLYGRQLRVDLLTPLVGPPKRKPVSLPGLGYAMPLRFLDYLLEDSQPAAVPSVEGILIRVPAPGRFALHKLVVAQRRPAAEANRRRKDRHQAAAVIDVLLEDDPEELTQAFEAARAIGGKFVAQLEQGVKGLPQVLRGKLAGLG